MSMRYLFGPVSAVFAEQCLFEVRRDGSCLAFDAEGKTDVAIAATDTWPEVCGRFPAGWQPDCIVLWLPYAGIPACLWSAPVPIIGVALDWPLLWHYYRRRLRACDLVLTDPPGVEVFTREGIAPVWAANLYGCDRAFVELADAADAAGGDSLPRDLDILFVGNLNPAVQRGRLAWLMRVARLGKRWRVAFQAGVFGDAYRRLLRRARIVCNQVGQPRWSRRIFEAASAGALVFEDTNNPATAEYFRDGEECVRYRSDNLEGLLEHYLAHEDERSRIAAAGRQRARHFTFAAMWPAIAAQIESESDMLAQRASRRLRPGKKDDLLVRTEQALNAPFRSDPALTRDLEAAIAAEPYAAGLRNALGLTIARVPLKAETAGIVADVAALQFQQAVTHNPAHLVAQLNLTEALIAAGQTGAAIEQAGRALTLLETLPEIDPAGLDGVGYPAEFNWFRVEWEKAAWANAGEPDDEFQVKKRLLQWQLRALLARLTGDVVHYYEAYLARPDLAPSSAALGCTLARAASTNAGERSANASLGEPSANAPRLNVGCAAAALPALRRALNENPLDRDAARALFGVLGMLGDRDGQRLVVEDRRLLSRAAPNAVPAEAWFSDPQPSGRELVSIIILCCNGLEYSRLCLESVLRVTRPPYELILVDNGSTDDTHLYLEEIRARPGPVRVDVVRNAANRGYPAGCNQGLARARGRFVVFLNNDTVVTPSWLEGMLAVGLRDWPSVGLVGAVSNYAPDVQGVRAEYATLDGLDGFAGRRRQAYAGRALDVRRLTGFCLLVRRDVFDRIGALDERYGLGFFDDDDLCLRAREAGFRLMVALDVYIHHFGSRTFQGLGVDHRRQLLDNFALFHTKWGAEHTAGYRLIGAEPTSTSSERQDGEVPPPISTESSKNLDELVPQAAEDTATPRAADLIAVNDRVPVSLCMIVKNEQERLPACLASVADLFDQIIIVDTGSTDDTIAVAKRYGAEVHEFPWADSFAAARNECLRYATGRWIMWLDADDRVDAENHDRLAALFASLKDDEMAAFAMKVRSVLDADGQTFRLLDQVRLFPNHKDICWEYRVHEQTLPAVLRLGGQVRWSGVVIDHVGYQEASVRKSKLERNLRLLEMDDRDRPDDSFTLFNLGWTLLDLGRTDEALARLERSLARSSADSSIMRKLYHLITVTQRQLGKKDRALAVCAEGRQRFPDDTELICEEALLLMDAKEWERAEACWRLLIETKPAPYFGSVDDGMRGYKTRDLLARHYFDLGRLGEAEIQWRTATAERPSFLPAWLGLGELYLRQGRWANIEPIAGAIEQNIMRNGDAIALRVRACLGQKDYVSARRQLDDAIEREPKIVKLRVLLSHVLLQQGNDSAAAEQALRDVLALDPENAEARQNLEILLRKRQPAIGDRRQHVATR